MITRAKAGTLSLGLNEQGRSCREHFAPRLCATVAEMTKFPLSMPYLQKAVKNKDNFLRRYDEIFKGEANAAQCFAGAEPQKESDRRYEIYCPFKDTPNDWENAPIRFLLELTKSGWKFSGLDNVNE